MGVSILPFLLLGLASGCGTGPHSPDAGAPPDGRAVDASFPGADAAELDGGGTSEADAGAPDAGNAPLGDVVTTDLGEVRGTTDEDLVVFLGIPYAAPPVGAQRFERPAPHPGWSTDLDATAYGPECPQVRRGAVTGSEDCLTLNVWAPRSPGPRPVMVFIHGGAFNVGSGSTQLYAGAQLARRGDAVIITLNYRLGVLGFLASEALAAEEPDGAVGNFGIWDQVAALAWIQRNAAAFGGDPANVTVFGESAGGMSVCVLLGAEAADGLFQRALIESGGGCAGYENPRASYFGRETMMARHARIVAAVGCGTAADVPACLRTLPFETLAAASGEEEIAIHPTLPASVAFAPNIDGVLLDQDPFDRVSSGARPDVPIVVGSNADEAFLFTIREVILTRAAYETRVRALAGGSADEVLAAYPASDFPSPKSAWNTLASDVGFICPALSLAEAASSGSAPAFSYHYTHVLGGLLGTGGAVHAAELLLVFGNYPASYTPRPEDLALGSVIQTAWTSFARNGSPAATPPWPAYTPGTESIAVLDTPLTMTDEIRQGRCATLRAAGVVR